MPRRQASANPAGESSDTLFVAIVHKNTTGKVRSTGFSGGPVRYAG